MEKGFNFELLNDYLDLRDKIKKNRKDIDRGLFLMGFSLGVGIALLIKLIFMLIEEVWRI